FERRARPGIEIDDRIVGGVYAPVARVPWIRRNRAELHDVEQRREVAADEPARRSFLARNLLDANAGWNFVRRLLLIERVGLNAVGVSLEHERPVLERRQQEWRHLGVVLEQASLGDLHLREEQLAEVRHVERPL